MDFPPEAGRHPWLPNVIVDMMKYSVPAGTTAAAALMTMIPPNFPHHSQPSSASEKKEGASRNSMEKDFPGTLLLLIATLLLVTALEEAGSRFPWKSAFAIALLVL